MSARSGSIPRAGLRQDEAEERARRQRGGLAAWRYEETARTDANGRRAGVVPAGPVLRAAIMLILPVSAVLTPLAGQVPTPRVPPPGQAPAETGADTTAPGTACVFPALPDTGRAPQLVQWPAVDSVEQALLARSGYVATKYCADSVAFDPRSGTLRLLGDAAIEREGVILIGDSVIYNDSTRRLIAFAAADEKVRLRDPAQLDDLIAGWIEYDLATRTGLVREVRTSVQSGQVWYLEAHNAAAQLPDSARGEQTAFFGLDGSLTSCNLEVPHYHFQARQLKMISKNIMVVRPAVLYIADIPVMWLPFVFQDMRDGRRSGILSPRLGFSDIVRNSPTYRRQVENVGYYFAISDYMDATTWLDWRSGARGSDLDPGWMRYNGELRYKWLDRFVEGRIGANHHRLQNGVRSTGLSLQHSQRFSLSSSLSANINYSTNTRVQRTTEFIPEAVLATIQSNVNYQQKLGPASLSVGGSRTQYPGRDEVNMRFPTLGISTGPISIGEWLTWTPNLNIDNSQRLEGPSSGPLAYRYVRDESGVLDSVRLGWDERNSTISFNTPLEIFGFRWNNSFRLSDVVLDYPQSIIVRDVQDTSVYGARVFQKTFRTSVDWETGISLPSLSSGRWNISPSVSIVNVDSRAFWVRSELTGGEFVRQSKRLRYGVSASPTFFGLWPGIGAFARFRHSLSPSVTWSYSPAASVSDEYLQAINQPRQTYIGALAQHQMSLGLSQVIEARLRAPADSAPDRGEKIKLLSINVTSLTFDFERLAEMRRRARESGRPDPGVTAGFATSTFGYSLRSDLLPGFNFRVDYSLFSGDRNSDTSKFSPFLTGISADIDFDRQSNPIVILSRIFGKAVPPTSSDPDAAVVGEVADSGFVRQVSSMPLAGQSRTPSLMVPQTAGWRASFTFSTRRQRPPTGDGVVVEYDQTQQCEHLRETSPVIYQLCLDQALANPTVPDTLNQTTPGGFFYRVPPTMSLQGNLGMNITPLWAMQWQTTYDFREKSFASHTVSLQRELHDWRAIFAFTQAPNGNFAFNFFIALKAEPDLKFDYNSRTYRAPGAR